MYKYDTHVHTMEASKCGKLSGADMARYYKGHGYDGIIITDHFFNGNTTAKDGMSWQEKVALFCSGYEAARAEGEKIGLDVFFGIEYNHAATEFLVYGLDKEWLLANEDCDKLSLPEFCALAHESGAFIVHAHPFRQRSYIKTIRLLPDCVDAVEVMNAAHLEDMPFDRRARWYADEFSLPITGGSDNHKVNQKYLGGILCGRRLASVSDYAQAVKNGEVEIFKFENPGYDGLPSHG